MNIVRRNIVATLLGLIALGCLAGGAVAQESTLEGQGALVLSQVDPAAEAVPLTVNYQATGETREAMGRYLLDG